MADYISLRGVPALQFLPRCATLVRYGGGDDMRQGEALVSMPLAAAALPAELRATVCDAVDAALADAPAAAAAGEYAAESQLALEDGVWARAACAWDVALAVTTVPVAGAAWANLYWHGWLFGTALDDGAAPNAIQRFPLCGIWEATAGIGPFKEEVAGESGQAFADGAGGRRGDVRAAGHETLRAADQHAHKVDAYAGGDRESTIALYMEQGFPRDAAEAAVLGDEWQAEHYHVGSDAARVALGEELGDQGPGAACWAVCVDLAQPKQPRAQATLLVALPGAGECARWFRRWSPAGGDAVSASDARADLAAALAAASLPPAAQERVAAALQA